MEDQSARIKALLNKLYPLKMFTDLQKDAIAANAVIKLVEEGEALYKEGEPANGMFLILYGTIRLTLPMDVDDPEAGEEQLGDLEAGDLVGLESLEEEGEYLTNAVGLETAKVACLKAEFLDSLFEDNPIPYPVLEMMLNSLRLFLKTDLPWRNPDEPVIFMARRHPAFLLIHMAAPFAIFVLSILILLFLIFTNLVGGLVLGIIAGLFALGSGLWSIWNYVDWTNDYTILTKNRVVFQERIVALYDSRQETTLEGVISTRVDTTQIGRMVGYGNVVVSAHGTLILPDLAQWEIVRFLVDDRRARSRETSILAERQALQSMVRQRLRLNPPAAPAVKQLEQTEEPAWSLSKFLADIFQMRVEKGGVITYRTHWFILLKKMFFPVLTLLSLLILANIYLFGVISFISPVAFWPVFALGFLLELFWLWYQYTDWADDQYIVSDEQIVDVYRRPFGKEEKQIAPLKSIDSVEFERLGIIGLFLNYGTVYLHLGGVRFTFNDIYNPSEVQRDIFRRIAAQANRERRKEADAGRQQILEMLEAYHEVVKQQPPPPAVKN
jgi:hypothetical protein